MISLDELFEFAKTKNIKISTCDLEDCNGICFTYIDRNFIYLNKRLHTLKEQKCALMEEIAHANCGILPSLIKGTDYYNTIIHSKNEYNATKYMVDNFIPLEIFNLLNYGHITKEELMDELEITEDLFTRVYTYLKGKEIKAWQEQLSIEKMENIS